MKPPHSLADSLRRIATFLDEHGERHWAERLFGLEQRARAGDDVSSEVLAQFGGMGTINDLWLSPANGHPIANDAVSAINERLDVLRSELYQSAH